MAPSPDRVIASIPVIYVRVSEYFGLSNHSAIDIFLRWSWDRPVGAGAHLKKVGERGDIRMGKLRWRSAAIALLLLPANAWAQKLPDCAEETAHVDELSFQGAANDFDGVRQEVAAAAYTRSRCMGDNVNRFHLEMFGAYVREPAGDAAAAIVGLGFELHPLGSEPNLTITPLARIGYEHFSGRGDRLVLGGALRVETVLWQKLESRGSGKDAYQIPRTQVLLGGTIEYTDRRSAGGTATGSYLVTSDSRATFGATTARTTRSCGRPPVTRAWRPCGRSSCAADGWPYCSPTTGCRR